MSKRDDNLEAVRAGRLPEPDTTIRFRYTEEGVREYCSSRHNRPCSGPRGGLLWWPKVGTVKLEQRRWTFPNGRGVVVTYKADTPYVGGSCSPGLVPMADREAALGFFQATEEREVLEATFGGERGVGELELEGEAPTVLVLNHARHPRVVRWIDTRTKPDGRPHPLLAALELAAGVLS